VVASGPTKSNFGMGKQETWNKQKNFKMVQEDLLELVKQLATKATKKAAPKNNRKRDKEDDTQEDCFSKEPCAKKPKVTDFDNKAIGDTRLLKLIARISEDDEHTKFQLTKEEILSLMDFSMAQCIAKLACLAAAEEEENCMNATENNVHNEDHENDDEPNVPNEPNELNEPNETNNQTYRYMNSSINIANQELQLPNSHVVVSRSYLSRLIESDKCLRKLKAKIVKAKRYRSSPLGQRFYTAPLIQAPRMSLYAGEQVIPLIVAAFLVDAGIALLILKPWRHLVHLLKL
jgi:hypothetical protein